MQLVITDPSSIHRARRDVDAELDAIESAASRFRPDSEINRLTRSSGRPTEISELLATILAAALRAARQTDGDVDPTIGAALISLGYDRDIAAIQPTAAVAGSATIPASWSMIRLDGRVATVPTGIVLDLGATAKAITADRCAQRAYESTGGGVLINLGGDIATAGEAPEGGWQVLVQDSADDPASSVALASGAAIATSSTVHRRWQRDEHPMHHILDPRTGQPSDPLWRTVSVTAETCLTANTFSTAAIIRRWAALDWLRAQGLPCRLVDWDREVRTLGGWPDPDDS